MRILIFPLEMDRAQRFLSVMKTLDIEIIGAGSTGVSGLNFDIKHFSHLPYVTDKSFDAEFINLIDEQKISHVYTPHPAVWNHLTELLKHEPIKNCFQLCEPSPYLTEWQDFIPSYTWADTQQAISLITDDHESLHAPLRRSQYAALHKQFLTIPGQSDADKLSALCELFRRLPKGDLIEIGSLAGRSAFALAWLASHYDIGSLISIDPWNVEKIEDQGNAAEMLNQELTTDSPLLDFEWIFHEYLAALALLNNVAYIREPSLLGIEKYRQASNNHYLDCPQLGKVEIIGHITLLHVDGNHRYDQVKKDLEQWLPYVCEGGWVLVDDYCWAFGDGPKRAGDELLKTGIFDCAFTMSDTLFLQKAYSNIN